MENASKALLMAAGVLIGLMVLSLAVYLFITFGSQSAEIHEQIDTDRLNQFNTQFTKYEGMEVTIYDVMTVLNLAKENNDYYGLRANEDSNYYIEVYLNRNSIMGESMEDLMIDDAYSGNDLIKYSCTVIISEITQRVKSVNFQRIS